MTTAPDDFERFVGMWADMTPEEDHVFQEILEERAGFIPTGESNNVTERLNQVYATESSELDPAWKAVVAALLADEDWTGSMTLKDYGELHNLPLDADAYRREFPEDAPFTHPPVNEE